MSILIHIEDLLAQHKVESERIEFKKGWNPSPIFRSICAFANDFEDSGSGYILVGVEEKEGLAVRPVAGIPENQLDKIQQEINQYCRKISPSYFPRVSIEKVDDKFIIAIWVPGGSNRPYKVPDDVTVKKSPAKFRIRYNSSSVVPNPEQEIELLQLTAKIPFDDQVNQKASVTDLDFGLMREHLAAAGSRLYDESSRMSIEELAEKMNLSSGGAELLFPKNVGLLMFAKKPTRFFSSAHIDIVEFPEGEGSGSFTEKTFTGPIQLQLQDALNYIKRNIIKSKVIKNAVDAVSSTVYNYPFEAIEEALPNAVYHRNYQENDPIEVRVLPNRIIMTSYNGADAALKQKDFDNGSIRARRYRNRRIGEFLKELGLTEGRATGVPRIIGALAANGSPPVVFDIDDPDRRYFIVELLIHPSFREEEDTREKGREKGREIGREIPREKLEKVVGYSQMTKRQKEVLKLIVNDHQITYEALKDALDITSEQGINNHIKTLKKLGALTRDGTKQGRWIIHYEEK